MITQLALDVVVLFSKAKSELEVVLVSSIAGASQSAELWRGRDTGAYALYHQDAYYNESLAARRAHGRMHHPQHKSDLMVLIGNVWGARTWSPDDTWEIVRSSIVLPDVCIDEL